MMQDNIYYYTIEQESFAEFKDRGSKFLAFVYPVKTVQECKQYIQHLKKEHSKAVHHCFAYQLGTSGNEFRASDDGEPAGTAGKPILNQINSKQLTNVLVVVVRYFGGTLLGVPGLINAYKTATALALQIVPVVQKTIEQAYQLEFDYTIQNEVMQIAKQYNCTVIDLQQQLFCMLTIGVPLNRQEEVLYKLKEMYSLQLTKVGGKN